LYVLEQISAHKKLKSR